MNNSSKPKDARQRILAAATESFQSLGFARTTTQAIAEKAGVAEVTIFRHFGDKLSLFKAAVQQIGGGVGFEEIEAHLTGDLESDLCLLAQHTITFFIAQQDAIRMLMFETNHFPEMQAALAQNPRGMVQLLDRYFSKQIKAGRLRKTDPQVAAQMFVSMIFGFSIGVGTIKESLPTQVPVDKMVDEIVRTFLDGNRVPE